MDRQLVYLFLIVNLIAGIIYYLKSKCEIPFLLALFNIMVEYRLISLLAGYSDWVQYDYGISFLWNFDIAFKVSDLILIGTSVLMYTFMIFYRPVTLKDKINDSEKYLRAFVTQNKRNIFIGLAFFTFLQLTIGSSAGWNSSGAYGWLLKLGNASFIIMLFLVVLYTNLKKFTTKLLYFGLFLYLAYLTNSTALRFQFLGWIIPIAYYFARDVKPLLKVFYLFIGIFLVMTVFSIEGVLRNTDSKDVTTSELIQAGFQRILIADDVNFIDGFMMMYQIYPNLLDYDYGLEHIEILLRPIPRSWWPGKPAAGWFQKYSDKYGTAKQFVGFSPTIYGVFYAEMGEFGNFFFGIIWAWSIAKMYRSFSGFNSILGIVLTGVLLSCLVPILRSGDLPGDFAIVLMTFWPLIVFVQRYKKFVKKQIQIEAYQKLIAAA